MIFIVQTRRALTIPSRYDAYVVMEVPEAECIAVSRASATYGHLEPPQPEALSTLCTA